MQQEKSVFCVDWKGVTTFVMDAPQYFPASKWSSDLLGKHVHRTLMDRGDTPRLILSPIVGGNPSLPQGGDFLDIGTGYGAFPLGIADAFSGLYPASRFIGVDLKGPLRGETPEHASGRVDFIWETDGLAYLRKLASGSIAFLSFCNVRELIGRSKYFGDIENNLPYLGYESLRILQENGVVFFSFPPFTKEDESIFSAYRMEGARLTRFYPDATPEDPEHGYSSYFRKVKM